MQQGRSEQTRKLIICGKSGGKDENPRHTVPEGYLPRPHDVPSQQCMRCILLDKGIKALRALNGWPSAGSVLYAPPRTLTEHKPELEAP